jgi:hypothetical protein
MSTQFVVQHDDAKIIHRADRELGVLWSAELAHRADPKR